MNFRLFGCFDRFRTTIALPTDYRTTLRWRPQLGDLFPDFTANSTQGPIHFHNWAKDNWTFLFSHPAAFTSVCSTEIADVAFSHDALTRRSVRPISISSDTVSDLTNWSEEISETFCLRIDFPLVSDPDHKITEPAGMLHPKELSDYVIRKSFLIDPSLRIRMIFEYPALVGRSMDETLRVIDALQRVQNGDVATPSGWQVGDPVLQARSGVLPAGETVDLFHWKKLRSYLIVGTD